MTTAGSAASAAGLQDALGRIGVRASVEARGRLAVLVAHDDATPLLDVAVRDRVSLLAREHGFTHTALELEG